eukprot:gene25656-28988_t
MPTVNALLWKHMMMNPIYGVLAQVWIFFGGTPVDWLTDFPLFSVIVIVSWQWLPFATLIFITSLQSMNREQLEASRMDGANYLQQLRYLYLPHLARSVAGLGADSRPFGHLRAPHVHALPPQSAPVVAAQPAYYFPPDSGTVAGSGDATTGWSPPGLNPHSLLPPPPLLYQPRHPQQQQGLGGVVAASASGVVSAPPPGLQSHQQQQQQQGLQRPKVSAPPPGLG